MRCSAVLRAQYRPSMFLTFAMPSYGPVTESGAPPPPKIILGVQVVLALVLTVGLVVVGMAYDYRRAALACTAPTTTSPAARPCSSPD